MFNERMGINVENGKSRICPKCGNRFHVFADYNRHCGGDLYWCECTECKTIRLVCSMANEMIEKHQKSVKFTTSLKILDEIKSTWGERGKNAENKLISDLTYADILIIDDFGAESGKDWINEKFYGIINGRYVDKKTTIFTSNYPISRLKYDGRITNRILERSLEIPFPEESVREHIADAMKQELIKKIQGGENGKQA